MLSSKNARSFKRNDLLLQIILPGIFFLRGDFFGTYIISGVVQVTSSLINKRNFADIYKVAGRKIYQRLVVFFLIAISLLGLLSVMRDSADIGRFMILIVGLATPFMALQYFRITLQELKKINSIKD